MARDAEDKQRQGQGIREHIPISCVASYNVLLCIDDESSRN